MEFRSPAPQKGLGKGVQKLPWLLCCRQETGCLVHGSPLPLNENQTRKPTARGQSEPAGAAPGKVCRHFFCQPVTTHLTVIPWCLTASIASGLQRPTGVYTVASFPSPDGDTKWL